VPSPKECVYLKNTPAHAPKYKIIVTKYRKITRVKDEHIRTQSQHSLPETALKNRNKWGITHINETR
jgi:hypothetical protein